MCISVPRGGRECSPHLLVDNRDLVRAFAAVSNVWPALVTLENKERRDELLPICSLPLYQSHKYRGGLPTLLTDGLNKVCALLKSYLQTADRRSRIL